MADATYNQSQDVPDMRRGAVAVIRRGERLLVIRRSALVVAPRAFCFPGGGIEVGESEDEALIREIREELGVCVSPRRRLWRSITPWGVKLAWWLAEIAPDCQFEHCQAEVESIHWHTPAEMLELPELLESNRQFLAALAGGEFSLD